VAFKTSGKAHFRSRNGKDFSAKYPSISKALASMSDETVIDGEIVALGAGRPSFNALQNHGAAASQLFFYVFDIMIAAGGNVMVQPLEARWCARPTTPQLTSTYSIVLISLSRP
jgi:bifunctional non-homologous end joining protein LigD